MVTGRGPRVVLLGKQGAGKGTQAARLAEHFGILHLSTGDLFRAAARGGTGLGVEAEVHGPRRARPRRHRRRRGRGAVLRHRALVANGFVLDGFPRTQVQASELDRLGATRSTW